MSSAPALLALALVLLAPVALGEDTSSYAPSAVVALDTTETAALVRWAPGESPADTYRVYGISSSGMPSLLLEAAPAEFLATVPGGFATYGVTGVQGGIESPLVLALGTGGDDGDCIARIAPPPDPHVIICEPKPRLVTVYRPSL